MTATGRRAYRLGFPVPGAGRTADRVVADMDEATSEQAARAAPAGAPGAGDDVDDGALLALCHQAADAVARALATVADWRPAGERSGQYAIDLVADRAVLEVFADTGIGVVSEESGTHRP